MEEHGEFAFRLGRESFQQLGTGTEQIFLVELGELPAQDRAYRRQDGGEILADAPDLVWTAVEDQCAVFADGGFDAPPPLTVLARQEPFEGETVRGEARGDQGGQESGSPGAVVTAMPSRRQARTKKKASSETPGVPASQTRAKDSPDFSLERSSGVLRSLLWSW